MSKRQIGALALTTALLGLLAGAGPASFPASSEGAKGAEWATLLVLLEAETSWDAWSRHSAPGSEPAPTHPPHHNSTTAARSREAALEAARRTSRLADEVERGVRRAGGMVVSRYDTALAGLLVRLPAAQAEQLGQLHAVRRVVPAPIAKQHLLDSVPSVGAPRVWDELGLDGSGSTIAIVDSGIDYTHAAFGGPGTEEAYEVAARAAESIDDTWHGRELYPTNRVVAGWDFAGPLYDPACAPADQRAGLCSALPQPDPDPLDEQGHGTLVAGVAAGESTAHLGPGVAPGADLVALKVFGASETTALVVDALEWAIEANMELYDRPHIDVINLSFGLPYGGALLSDEGVFQRAAAAEVTVVASAGNDRDLPYILAGPASDPHVLAVASITPPGRHKWEATLRAGGSTTQFVDEALAHQGWSPDPRGAIEAPVVYVGRGCPALDGQPEDPYLANPSGAIAVFEMTWELAPAGCTVDRQARRTQEEGALAALMATALGIEAASPIEAEPRVDIPVWMVNHSLEQAIVDAARGQVPLQISLEPVAINELAGTVSAFTSRGPSSRALLKPDLSAPGAGVFSAAIGQGQRGTKTSGTSIAAPHVSGAAALVRSAARGAGWEPTALDVAAIVVSTADPDRPRKDAATSSMPPLARVGSGAVDAWVAATVPIVARSGSSSSISPGFLALAAPRQLVFPVSLANPGRETRRLRLRPVYREQVAEARPVVVSVDPTEVELEAGDTATASVTIDTFPNLLAQWEMAGGDSVGSSRLLTDAETDGWIELSTDDGERAPTVRLPFYILARRASAVQVIEREPMPAFPAPGEIVTLTITNSSPFPGRAEMYHLGATDPAETNLRARIDVDAAGLRVESLESGGTLATFVAHTRGERAHPASTRTSVELDVDDDGAADYRIYTHDEELLRSMRNRNGRIVAALAETGSELPDAPITRYYAGVDLHSRYTALPIMIEDTGLAPGSLEFSYRFRQEDLSGSLAGEAPPVDEVPDGGGWLRYEHRAQALTLERATVKLAASEMAEIDVTVSSGVGPRSTGGLLVIMPDNPPGSSDSTVWRLRGIEPLYLPRLDDRLAEPQFPSRYRITGSS